MRRVLIGYSMRSGSTLLQHVLGQHSRLRAFSDLSSGLALLRLVLGSAPRHGLCVKPVDLFYLHRALSLERYFDRFVWLTRDPRDAYLSSIESGYAYLLRRRGEVEAGIDTGLLDRWKRIHRVYFDAPERWHLVRYEDLVASPEEVLGAIQDYLGLPRERLLPFDPFKLPHGGDFKVRETRTVHGNSVGRHRGRLTAGQYRVFEERLGEQMARLGYAPGPNPSDATV